MVEGRKIVEEFFIYVNPGELGLRLRQLVKGEDKTFAGQRHDGDQNPGSIRPSFPE